MKDSFMEMWTVYINALDYPDSRFVARRFLITGGPAPEPTGDVLQADSIHTLRAMLPKGLMCFPRSENDQPHIVETWF